MSENTNRVVVQCLAFGTKSVREKCQHLSQAESLQPIGSDHNCVNWTIGHMLLARNSLLTTLGDESFVWSDQDNEAYGEADTVEEAARKAAGGRDIARLLDDLDTTLGLLQKALADKDLRDFEGKVPFVRGEVAVHEFAGFLTWHEGTHVGEISVMCEVLKS